MKKQRKLLGGEIVVIVESAGYVGVEGHIARILFITEGDLYKVSVDLCPSGLVFFRSELREATGGEKRLFRAAEKRGLVSISTDEMKANKYEPKSV